MDRMLVENSSTSLYLNPVRDDIISFGGICDSSITKSNQRRDFAQISQISDANFTDFNPFNLRINPFNLRERGGENDGQRFINRLLGHTFLMLQLFFIRVLKK
jgi:hypothetical protein